MKLRVGDHVKVLNEALEGIVSKIASEKEVYVQTDDGFDYLYPVNELIRVSSEEDTVEFHVDEPELLKKLVSDQRTVRRSSSSKSEVVFLKSYIERGMMTNKRNDSVVEIDLHLQELVANPGKLNNWEKIHIQVEHFKNCIEEAMRLKVTDLVFIHGIGEGRLKEEVRAILRSYPNIDFHDADYSRYGYGATAVRIKGLFAG